MIGMVTGTMGGGKVRGWLREGWRVLVCRLGRVLISEGLGRMLNEGGTLTLVAVLLGTFN